MQRQTRVYPISIVAQLTGLSQRQIRYYESMGVISPLRSKGKQRLYSPSEIDTLLAVKILLGRGLTLQGIRKIIESPQFPEMLGKTLEIPRLDYEELLKNLYAEKASSHDDLIDRWLGEKSDAPAPVGHNNKGVTK